MQLLMLNIMNIARKVRGLPHEINIWQENSKLYWYQVGAQGKWRIGSAMEYNFYPWVRVRVWGWIYTSRRSCHRSFQILIFLDLQSRFLFPFLLYKILVWKNRSWLSGKIHVDRILTGEARSSSPVKILVFFNSCLILFFL